MATLTEKFKNNLAFVCPECRGMKFYLGSHAVRCAREDCGTQWEWSDLLVYA